jgi:hypothetical protein
MMVGPMSTPRREAALSVGLLLAMLAGLMLARWGLAGGFSRPLIPATPTPPPAAGAAPAAGMPELRGRMLYLGGRQLLVADAGGGPLRPLRMRVAGRTSVLRQGRYLVVRVAEQLQEGPVLALATGGPGAATPLGSALDVLPSPQSDRVWLLDRRARTPQRTFALQEVELATGRQLATITLPSDAEPVAMVNGGVLVRDLRQELAVRDLTSGREGKRFGTDLTFVDATARLVAYLDDRGDLHVHDLATRRDLGWSARPASRTGSRWDSQSPARGAATSSAPSLPTVAVWPSTCSCGVQPSRAWPWSTSGGPRLGRCLGRTWPPRSAASPVWAGAPTAGYSSSRGPPPDVVAAWRPGRPSTSRLDLPLDGATAIVRSGLAA